MALTECVECGGKLSTRAEVCIHCGCPVEPPTPEINCPDCGEDFAGSLTTCPACGGPAEEVEILESVAVEDEPAPIIQETVSASSTEPESVATKDEPFNSYVAFAIGGLVFQIARSLGLNFGALTVVFLLVPWALLVRYGKKQSPQVYAGIIGALIVVMGIAIAVGPGDVFITQGQAQSDVQEEYWPNGQLMYRTTLKDGVIHGPYESYHSNGRLMEKTTFKDGEMHGLYEDFTERGAENLKGIYQNGERCGDWFELFKTISYPPCDGPVETKYANGKLRSKGIYKDGEKCGEWIDEGEPRTYDPC